VHASHVAVQLYSISLPHWLNVYASYCIFIWKQWTVHMHTVNTAYSGIPMGIEHIPFRQVPF
jgi:hypothetical protein